MGRARVESFRSDVERLRRSLPYETRAAAAAIREQAAADLDTADKTLDKARTDKEDNEKKGQLITRRRVRRNRCLTKSRPS